MRKQKTLVEDRITEISGDRRCNRRYGLELPLAYSVMERGRVIASGTGTTIDISSTGMSFLPGARLAPGMVVEAVVEWPAAEGERPMELIVMGNVVRADDGGAAIRNAGREFRPQRELLAMAAG